MMTASGAESHGVWSKGGSTDDVLKQHVEDQQVCIHWMFVG